MSDEARHVAFGVLSLKEYYEGLTDAELAERQEFAFEAAVRMRDRLVGREVWDTMGVDPKEAMRVLNPFGDDKNKDPFQMLLFSKIVPNLSKLGLLDAERRLAPHQVRRPRRDPVRDMDRHLDRVRDARRRDPGSRRRRLVGQAGMRSGMTEAMAATAR